MFTRTRHVVGLLALGCLAVMSLGCASADSTVDLPTEATLAADSRVMAAIFETRADSTRVPYMHIDLKDERQYRFVRNRLLASGNTPENAPYLFELLENGRMGKGEKAQEGAEVANTNESSLLDTTTSWCGHFVLLEERVNTTLGNTRFLPSVIMSCFDGASYSYLDGAAYKTPDVVGSNYTLLDNRSMEQYNGGIDLRVKIGKPLDDNPDPTERLIEFGTEIAPVIDDNEKTLVIDSLAIAEKNGVQHFTYVTIRTMGPGSGGAVLPAPPANNTKAYMDVPSIQLQHPRNLINSSEDSKVYWDYTYFPDTDNRVRVCLERGYAAQIYGGLDCDYATVNKDGNTMLPFSYPFTGIAAVDHNASLINGYLKMDPTAYWHAFPKYEFDTKYIPIQGKYKLYYPGGCTIDSYDPAFTQAQIVMYESGGFCNGQLPNSAIGTGLGDAMQTGASSVDAQFDMLGNFGGGCSGSSMNKRSHLYVMVYAKTKGVPGGAPCGNRYTTRRVTPMDFLKSCFAEGTEVRRADGKLVPVEQFHTGDKVIANREGLVLTVTGVVVGGESKPLVNLYDNHGHDLFVTEHHPIVTTRRGIVQAVDLAEGDEVLTEDGPATLTSVQRVGYDRQVYNLALGTKEELARAGKKNRTMYAEGYLVGDNEMQFEIESAPKPRPDSIASTWARDHSYDVAQGRAVGP